MPALFTNNPLYVRLIHYLKGPSLRMTLWLGCALTLVSSLLTAYVVVNTRTWLKAIEESIEPELIAMSWMTRGYLAHSSELYWLGDTASKVFWGAIVVLSILAALAAVDPTATKIQGETYGELRLTVPKRYLVRGFVFAALFRLRLLLMLVITLTPLLVISPYQHAVGQATYQCYAILIQNKHNLSSTGVYDRGLCVEPGDTRLLIQALMDIPQAIGGWGLVLLGAATGVTLTLWKKGDAWLGPAVVIACVLPIGCCIVLTLLGPSIGSAMEMDPFPFYGWSDEWGSSSGIIWPRIILVSVLIMVTPYVPVLGMMRLAQRWT